MIMLNNPEKILIKKNISDNIYAISQDDTNEILYSEIQSLLQKENYSDYFIDIQSIFN